MQDLEKNMELLEAKNRLIALKETELAYDPLFLSWAYYCIVYGHQLSDQELTDQEIVYSYNIYQKIKDKPQVGNFEQWLANFCVQKGFAIHYLPNFDGYRSAASFGPHQSERAQAIYDYHTRILDGHGSARKYGKKDFERFIQEPRWPKDRIPPRLTIHNVSQVVRGLTVPKLMTLEEARLQVKSIKSTDYAGLTQYGADVGIDMRRSVTAVLDFIAAAYAVPTRTLTVIEDILSQKNMVLKSLDGILEGIEANGVQKKRGLLARFRPVEKPRIVPFEESPLFKLFNDARELPDHAKEDNALYQRQIEAVQLAIDVIERYDQQLSVLAEALEGRVVEITKAQQSRQVVANEELSLREVVDFALSKEWTDKLQSLRADREFAKLHAVNLAVTLDKMTDMQLQIAAVSGLSANLAIPYQQAQAAFMAYQSHQFGQAIDLSSDLVMGTDISTGLSRETIRKLLEAAIEQVSKFQELDQSRKQIGRSVLTSPDTPQRF